MRRARSAGGLVRARLPAACEPVQRRQPRAHRTQQAWPATAYRQSGRFAFFPRRRDRVVQAHFDRLVPPAKGEGAADQRPVAANGAIAPDHEVGPAELILHLLVALLDPVAQTVQARHFRRLHPLDRQVGGQIPGRQFRQGVAVGRHAHDARRLAGVVVQ